MHSDNQAPFERAYWIQAGALMGGCYPGDLSPAEAEKKLRGLVESGVTRVINLMEEDEVDSYGRPFAGYEDMMRSMAAQQGREVSFIRYPIRDMGVASREQMKAILDDIDAAVGAGQVVYVHCWGGIGRTGTVAACYLSRHGLAEGRDVLEHLAGLRSRVRPYRPAPESEPQRTMARSWKKGE